MCNNDLIILPFDRDDLTLPPSDGSIDEERALEKRTAILDNARQIKNRKEGSNSLETGLEFEGIKIALGFETDAQARLYIAARDDNDVFEGVVLTPALQETLFIRAEEARANNDTEAQAECQDTMKCLTALSDSTIVATQLSLLNQDNVEQWKGCRSKFLKNTQPEECGITGEQLGPSPDVDHDPRRVDSPENTLNPNVLKAVNKKAHIDKHNKNRKKAGAWMKEQTKTKPETMVGKPLQSTDD